MAANDFQPMLAQSRDHGRTWENHRPIWPQLAAEWSIFVSISRSPDGRLMLFGMRWPIDEPGESFWSDETQGLKQNELVWSCSHDDGRSWQPPRVVPIPVPGAAEAPAPLCVTSDERWLGCYSPYHTFDPELSVDRSRVIVMASDDQGQTWKNSEMLRFSQPRSGGAEAWVIQLSNGRLLGTGWHLHLDDQQDYPNPYALSDDGLHWGPTRCTGIIGQSVGLAALPNGYALMAYNQRKSPPIGVWLTLARPTDDDFGLLANQIVWRAEVGTHDSDAADHSHWTNFRFGEPSVTVLDDGTLLVVFWVDQPDGRGVRFVRLRMKPDG